MIRTLEEYALNAQPAMQTMVYDGWLLRFAGGYSKRANSVNPLYLSTIPPMAKIRQCEQIYAAKKQPAIFKLTPAATPVNLDELLAEQGYRRDGIASVHTLDLASFTPVCAGQITTSGEISPEWLNQLYRFKHIAVKDRPVLKFMLKNIIPNKYIVSLTAGGRTIGSGVGVLQDEYIGLYDIVIDSACRNQGFGQKLVSGLLQLGCGAGAKKAYLQVMTTNLPALRLYERLGFRELYQYWFRVKQDLIE